MLPEFIICARKRRRRRRGYGRRISMSLGSKINKKKLARVFFVCETLKILLSKQAATQRSPERVEKEKKNITKFTLETLVGHWLDAGCIISRKSAA